MISIEALLAPISADKPCGDAPTSAAAYAELQTFDKLLSGNPGGVTSKPEDRPEEPKWGKVEEAGLELFARCKHLHIAVGLTLAWLCQRGFPGFRDGLTLLHGLVERHWISVHPQLDPDDQNDPTERINLLAALCNPPGSLGDTMKFAVRLRQAPLCHVGGEVIRAGELTTSNAEQPTAAEAGAEEDSAAPMIRSEAQLKNLFTAAPPEEIAANHQALDQSLATIRTLDHALTNLVSLEQRLSWSQLVEDLTAIKQRFAEFTPDATGSTPSQAAGSAAGAGAAAGGAGLSGTVQSRADVRRVLQMACDYYQRAEPSSPVPLLLARAVRLMDKDFLGVMQDLNPEALGPLHVIVGDPSAKAATEK